MRRIDVSDEAFQRLTVAAHVAGVTLAGAVDRLVGIDHPSEPPSGPAFAGSFGADPQIVSISRRYRGHYLAGRLNLATGRITITDAPDVSLLRTYGSPSTAASQTIRVLNPARRHPETNGWRFWYADDGTVIDKYRIISSD